MSPPNPGKARSPRNLLLEEPNGMPMPFENTCPPLLKHPKHPVPQGGKSILRPCIRSPGRCHETLYPLSNVLQPEQAKTMLEKE